MKTQELRGSLSETNTSLTVLLFESEVKAVKATKEYYQVQEIILTDNEPVPLRRSAYDSNCACT